jgi:hypothetical protein
VAHPDFVAGRISTQFLERILPELSAAEGRFEPIAVIAAALAEYDRLRRPGNGTASASAADPANGTAPASAWRLGLRPGWRAGIR